MRRVYFDRLVSFASEGIQALTVFLTKEVTVRAVAFQKLLKELDLTKWTAMSMMSMGKGFESLDPSYAAVDWDTMVGTTLFKVRCSFRGPFRAFLITVQEENKMYTLSYSGPNAKCIISISDPVEDPERNRLR